MGATSAGVKGNKMLQYIHDKDVVLVEFLIEADKQKGIVNNAYIILVQLYQILMF